jgi:hypothetical protein
MPLKEHFQRFSLFFVSVFWYDKEGYGIPAIGSSIEAAFLLVVFVPGDVCFLSLQCTAWPIAWIPVSFVTKYKYI